MDKQQIKDFFEYVAAFLGLLFLAFKEQFGIELSQSWIDMLLAFGAVVVSGWGIYHNKNFFNKLKDKKKKEKMTKD